MSKAVRTGFTFAQSWKSFKKRAFRDPSKPKIKEIFASKNLKTAQEYIKYHRKWAEALNLAFGHQMIDISSWTTEICKYPGGDVEIFSSDPDAFRGLEGDVTLDEFAYHEQQDALYASAQSRIQWLPDGQLTLFSSHSHPETTFARLESEFLRGNSEFSWHRVTIEDAVREGLAFKNPGKHQLLFRPNGTKEERTKSIRLVNETFLKSIRAKCLSEEDWQREYMCHPAAGGSLVKADEYDRLIFTQKNEDGTRSDWPVKDFIPPDIENPVYIGIDIGRSKDLTVIWAIEHGTDPTNPRFPDVFRTVAVKSMRNAGFPEQERAIRSFLNHPAVSRAVIDQGTQGRSVSDAMHEEFGYMVLPIGINATNKAHMCERVRQFVQQERISLPRDSFIRSDILAMRRVAADRQSGRIKYEGQVQGSHCDHFLALAMALEAASKECRIDVATEVEVIEGEIVDRD